MSGRFLAPGLAWLAGLFVLGLAGFYLLGLRPAPEAAASPRLEPVSAVRRTPVVEVVERVSPAVVNVSTDRVVSSSPFRHRSPFDFFFGEPSAQPRRRVVPNSLGSGAIVHPDGYVLTNYHVLMRADAIQVTMADGTQHEAVPVGADPTSDLAVLKIEGEGPFPTMPMGTSSDLMIGETAIAIGNPFGLGHTVTTGVVSALNRTVQSVDETAFTDFIQTDAAIHPGNSGGPLLNVEGRLIGINTAIRPGAENIGFAIPVDRARRVLEELLAYGAVRPTWLGLEVWEVTPSLARRLGVEAAGLVVRRVHDDSPAERAGVEAGDQVLAVDGSPVEGFSAWRTLLSHHAPGDSFQLELRRDGRDKKVRLSLEALDRERIMHLARTRMGLVLGEPTRAERLRRMPGDVLVVREVLEGGPADEIGLVPGDLVTRVDGKRVRNLDEFADGFARIWERRAVMLRVARRGSFYRVTLEMD